MTDAGAGTIKTLHRSDGSWTRFKAPGAAWTFVRASLWGSSTIADSGMTAAVGGGELVFGGFVGTNAAGALTPGSSQGVTFVERAQSSSGTQGDEDVLSTVAGQQHAGFTFATSVPWFMVCAVFKAA
jgi:hypothetical protein